MRGILITLPGMSMKHGDEKKKKKEKYLMCFDMNPLLSLLTGRDSAWVQPWVLSRGEQPQAEKKSDTSEWCKLPRFLTLCPPKKNFRLILWGSLSCGVCSSLCSTAIDMLCILDIQWQRWLLWRESRWSVVIPAYFCANIQCLLIEWLYFPLNLPKL